MVLALPPGLEDLSDTGSVDLRQTARDAARRYGVNPERFVRQITQESNFNPQARNASSGARGVAQFMPDTAKELGVDPNDPVASLDAAAKYVRRNTDYHGGDERAGFASYDAGPGTIENLKKQYGSDWETHLPDETKTYLGAIYGDSAPGGADAAWAHPLTAGDSATALRRIGNRIGVDPQAAAITGQEAILADQQNQGAEPDNLLARLRQSRGQEATSGGFRDTELQTDPNANTDNPLTLLKRVSDTRVPILSPAAEAVQGAVGDAARPIVRTAASVVTGGPLLDAASAVGGENLPVVGNVLAARRKALNTIGDVGGDLASGLVPTTAGGFAAAALGGDVANAGEAAGRVASAGRGALERAAVSGLEGDVGRAPEAIATAGGRLLQRGNPGLAGAAEEDARLAAANTPEAHALRDELLDKLGTAATPETVASAASGTAQAPAAVEQAAKSADVPLKEYPGIKAALAAKEEATLTPGAALGPEGGIRRKVVGAINPSVDMPREVHVANQARVGVLATSRSEWSGIETPAYKNLERAFETHAPEYIGPAERPLAGTWVDYAENPRYYKAGPELTNAKEDLRAAQDFVIGKAKSEYGVDVGRFQGADPEGVYIPHMQSRDSLEQAVTRTEQSLSSRSSVAKERAYDSLSDRVAKHPDFKPETDPAVLADVHSSALASSAANNTFKAGVNGKTLTEVIDETHPGLRDARDKLATRVQNVKNKIDLAERRAVENNSALAPILKEQAAVDERAVPRFVALAEADKLTPELKRMSTQLQELKVRATSIDKAVTRLNGRGAAVDLRLNDARSELGQLEPQLAQLRQRYHTAAPGDYVRGSDFAYHTPANAQAIKSVLKTGFDNAFIDGAIEAGNTARAVGLGPDFSPLTIQGGLGALSHPEVAIGNAKGLVKAAFQSPESFAKSLAPAVVKRFEFATNRRLGSLSEEVLGESKVFGRELKLPGTPIKKFNDALTRVVDYGTVKAFENDSALLMKMGQESQNVADHEAANALSKIIPRMNNAETGRSLQRVKLEGVLPTSRSFTAQPFAFAKDFVSGLAKIPTGGELLGREKLALVRGTTLLGTMMTISIGSALAFAEANGKDPAEAVKEVTDPSSSKFMHVIIGSQGSIPLGGPFRSAILGVFRTATQGPAGAVQYARGRLQPEVGTAYDVTVNRDWKGAPIRTGSDWNQILQSVTEFAKSANLLSGGTIQGYEQNGAKGAAEQFVSGAGGVNYTERSPGDQRDALAVQLTGKHYNELPPEDRKQFDQRPEVLQTREGVVQSDYKKASEAAHADTVAEVKREEDLFNAGKNDRKLSDVYRSESDANRATAKALEGQFASQFAGFDKTKYDKAVEGYYGTEKKIPDGEVGAGGIDFDATSAARDDYLRGLPSDQREWVSQALQVARENKTPLHQEYLDYIDAKKNAGYFADGLTAKEKAALDVAHPELDVAQWKFGSVGGKSGGALQTAQAVSMALASPDSQHREVKYAGLPTAINESAGTRAAWEQYGERAAKFLGGFQVERDKEKYAQQKFHKAFDDLKDNEKQSVTSFIKTGVLDSSPDLEAYLAYMGQRDTISTDPKAIAALRDLRTKYGREKRPDTNPIRYR